MEYALMSQIGIQTVYLHYDNKLSDYQNWKLTTCSFSSKRWKTRAGAEKWQNQPSILAFDIIEIIYEDLGK